MSDTVHYRGVLKPTGKTLTEYAGEDADIYDDKFYQKIAIIDDLVYEVEKTELDPCDDIFRATKNADGSIDFEIKYYNGGCSFYDAVEYAIDTTK